MKKRILVLGGLVGAALFGPLTGTALAQEVSLESVATAVDNVWVIVAAAMVFLMQAGFALVEAGFTRAKNTANIVMKNFMDFSVGSLAFWAVGFSLAYGGTTVGGFFATGNWFVSDPGDSVSWFFQVVFAATAATIVSGAMAERTKFTSYLVYTTFISGLIYPVVVHWVWSGQGWLGDIMGGSFMDFAGSGVVHLTGGAAAFVGAAVLGPRIGKYDSTGKALPIPGHSLMLGALGVFILWFGWYGFNGGSTLAAVGQDFASVCVTTTLAAAAGSLAAMFAAWWQKDGRPDPAMTLNGALAGLVGITAGCAFVDNRSAVIIGLVAGFLVVYGIRFVDRLRVDDPVGAVAVHGINGIWGLLAVGLFATEGGVFNGGGFDQLAIQGVGALAIIAWVVVSSAVVFLGIKYTVGLRVSAEVEIAGLDRIEHGASAYPEFMEQLADPRHLDPIS